MKRQQNTKNGWNKSQSFDSAAKTISPEKTQVSPSQYLKLYSDKSSKIRLEHSLVEICGSTRTKMLNSDSKVNNLSEVHMRKQYLVEHQKCQQQILKGLRIGNENIPNSRYFREGQLPNKKIKGLEGKLVKKVMSVPNQRSIVLPSIATYSVQQALTKFIYKKPIEVLIPKQTKKHEATTQESQQILSPIKKPIKNVTQYDGEPTTRSKQIDDKEQKQTKRGSLELDNSIFEEQQKLGNEVRQFLSKFKKKLT